MEGTPFVDILGQVPVHQVALTSVQIVSQNPSDEIMYAAIGVWADLSGLPDECLPWAQDGDLPAVYVTDAYLLPDRARLALCVAPAETFPRMAGEPVPDETPFTIIVPTTAVALATSLMMSPAHFPMILIDGPAPADPAFATIDPDTITAVIDLDPGLTHDALHDTVDPALHMPIPFPQQDQYAADLAAPSTERDLLWMIVSGVAMGHTHALNRAISTGQFWQASEAGAPERHEAAIAAGTFLAEASMDAMAEYGAEVALNALPAPMVALAEQIGISVDTSALINLVDGVPFTRVCAEHGIAAAAPALAVVAAARAIAVAGEDMETGATPSWLLGSWLDDVNDEPFWATRPLVDLLSAYDTTVAADLLGVGPSDAVAQEASLTLRYAVHGLVDAMLDMDATPTTIMDGLASNPVRPGNYADMALLASTLLTAGTDAAEDEEVGCAGCEAANTICDSGWNLKRLAAAASALLPALADLSAARHDHGVGEPDWVSHRTQFMGSLMDGVARAAAVSSQFD